MRQNRPALLCTTLLLACATESSSQVAATPDENAPIPYTAVQLRAASRIGRTYDFRVEAAGKPASHHVMQFVDVNDQSTSVRNTFLDDQGKEMAPAGEMRASWDDLRHHAMFPRAAVTIHEERVTVPAGAFDCLVYVVQGKDGEVSVFDFARDLAGPPVLFYKEQNGARVTTSTLVHYEPGR